MSKRCPVTRGEVDLRWYAERDQVWRAMGLAAPARRALIDNNIVNLPALRKFSIDEISQLHGIGPTAVKLLKPYLKRRKDDPSSCATH